MTVMNEVMYKNLEVCVDCAAVIANNDWTNMDTETEARIREAFERETGYRWELTCDPDDEDNCTAFSSWPCDLCKSPLAGSRHSAMCVEMRPY